MNKGNTAQSPCFALCTHLACIFSVILHKFSLAGVSPPASSLYNLTKNLTAQSAHKLCTVLPKIGKAPEREIAKKEKI